MEVFREHGGLLRTKDALEEGIHSRTLYRLRDQGLVDQLTRGVYRLAELPVLTQPDLVTIALRVPQAVICLVSALAYHELTTEIPHEVHIALPRHTKAPQFEYPPVRTHWFSEPSFSAGVEVTAIDDVDVRVYSLPKTVVDCFRLRNKIGLDVALEALREAMKDGKASSAELLHYARLCRMENVMLPYLQAMQ